MKVLVLVILVFSKAAFAQPADSCKDILVGGVFNQTTTTSAETASRAMYAQLCASSYKEAQKIASRASGSSAGGSVGGSYAGFGLNIGGSKSNTSSFTEQEFNKWKQDSCNTTSSNEASSAADYLMQKVASEPIVTAWAQCMTKLEGLTCWVSPFEEKDAIFTVNWNKQSTTKAFVVFTDLTNDAVSRFDGAPKGKLLPSNYQLDPGPIQIPITRQAGKSMQVVMNTNHAGTNSSCRGYVPSNEDFKLKSVVVPAAPQLIEESGLLGCSVQAIGTPCTGSWQSSAPPNYKVCSAVLRYVSGPTSGARMDLSRNPTTIAVNWSVNPAQVLFGPGRWVQGTARVVYVPSARNTDDSGAACS